MLVGGAALESQKGGAQEEPLSDTAGTCGGACCWGKECTQSASPLALVVRGEGRKLALKKCTKSGRSTKASNTVAMNV